MTAPGLLERALETRLLIASVRDALGMLGVVTATVGALWWPSAAAADSFGPGGTEQTFIVPAGVTTVHVVAVGGKGAGQGSASGGAGAQVSGDLSVTPGQTLYVEVGANGVSGQAGSFAPPAAGPGGAGGFDGGGAGGTAPSSVFPQSGGGGGGGASDIRTIPAAAGGSLSSRLLVAGGGGGAGGGGQAGGAAGAAGTNGTAFPPPGAVPGGGAGTASGGGQGGCGTTDPPENGGPGTGGKGGDGSVPVPGFGNAGGGGGGGGFFGGGGGCGGTGFAPATSSSSGGGGGSSFTGSASNAVVSTDTSGNPSVTITAVAPPAPPAPVVQAPADFAPHCGLTASRRQSAFARTGDLVTTAVCDKDASVTVTGTVFAPSTGAQARSARARHRYQVSADAVQVQAHQPAVVHLRLSRSALRNIRRALRAHREVSAALSLRATDAAGRLAQATTTVDAIKSRRSRARR